MSSTDEDRSRTLAGALFDEVVAPLAAARKAAGQPAYFPLAGSPGAKSYFEEPILRRMSALDFEFPGGGTTEGLVEALAARWSSEGEMAMAAMAPTMKQIAEALKDEVVKGDGSVSILCYTMF